MKKTIAVIIFSIFILSLSYLLIAARMTEKQKYTVVQKTDYFEIRHYSPVILATYYSKAKTYKELSGKGFRKIGYINLFG